MKNNQKLALNGGPKIRKVILPFGKPDIRKNDINSVVGVMRSGWIGTGPKVVEFESRIKDYIGVKIAVATSSASAALHLSLLFSKIGSGDEVITSSMTFPSTVNMIENVGAIPVFVDVNPKTGLIDPENIKKAITKKTKAILPIHLYGVPCDMDAIGDIAGKHNLTIIEDAAEAFGAEYKGVRIGKNSHFAAFSFAVNKVITTAEGGMLVSDIPGAEDELKMLLLHGLSKGALVKFPYKGFKEHLVELLGYKYNMTDMHAALGISQLKRIEEIFKKRKEIADKYNKNFKDLPMQSTYQPDGINKHGLCFYAVLLNLKKLNSDRNTIQKALMAENIGTGIHFYPMHLQPYYAKKYGYKVGDFPNTELFYQRILSLPMASGMTDKDINDVIKAVSKVLNFYKK